MTIYVIVDISVQSSRQNNNRMALENNLPPFVPKQAIAKEKKFWY